MTAGTFHRSTRPRTFPVPSLYLPCTFPVPSQVDSAAYLATKPEGARTPLYHAIINGYMKHAAARGFEHAHIWVAPPEDESSEHGGGHFYL